MLCRQMLAIGDDVAAPLLELGAHPVITGDLWRTAPEQRDRQRSRDLAHFCRRANPHLAVRALKLNLDCHTALGDLLPSKLAATGNCDCEIVRNKRFVCAPTASKNSP